MRPRLRGRKCSPIDSRSFSLRRTGGSGGDDPYHDHDVIAGVAWFFRKNLIASRSCLVHQQQQQPNHDRPSFSFFQSQTYRSKIMIICIIHNVILPLLLLCMFYPNLRSAEHEVHSFLRNTHIRNTYANCNIILYYIIHVLLLILKYATTIIIIIIIIILRTAVVHCRPRRRRHITFFYGHHTHTHTHIYTSTYYIIRESATTTFSLASLHRRRRKKKKEKKKNLIGVTRPLDLVVVVVWWTHRRWVVVKMTARRS